MKHKASPRFWKCYRQLRREVHQLADESYHLWLQDPHHPSPHFKKIGRFWAARVGLHYRALAVEDEATIVWFWVGRIPSMIGSLVASESAARRRRK